MTTGHQEDTDPRSSTQLLKDNTKKDNYDEDSSNMVPYLLTHDIDEIDRLHKQHQVVKEVCGGNFDAPIHDRLVNGIRVLDSGCGPGSWIAEMSQEYPASTFQGIDVSSDMLDEAMHKSSANKNCFFSCENILQQSLSPFPDNHFGFVHQQFLGAAVPRDNGWQNLLHELMRIIEPGGWIELTELVINDVTNAGPVYTMLNKSLRLCALQQGMRISAPRELELYLINAGASNIEVKPVLLPINHDGHIGELWGRNVLYGLFGGPLRPLMEKFLPERYKDHAEFDKLLDQAAEECAERKSWMLAYRIHAQKPHHQ